MRGFLGVSIALIAGYAFLANKNGAKGVQLGGGVLTTALQKLISPKVAAIPQIKSAIPKAAASSGPSTVAPGPNNGVQVPPS